MENKGCGVIYITGDTYGNFTHFERVNKALSIERFY